MGDTSRSESQQAGREARDAVVGRPRGSKSDAIADAMRRYLGAESYQEQRKHDTDDERPARSERDPEHDPEHRERHEQE
ncbi:MAG: hypothetical protein QM747_16975 [Nocardioides sp.]